MDYVTGDWRCPRVENFEEFAEEENKGRSEQVDQWSSMAGRLTYAGSLAKLEQMVVGRHSFDWSPGHGRCVDTTETVSHFT
ncbi:unnamed protein product [Soboliphyme baturini]|uniref:Uncharacterized protein n=1 Tax=Soboliphyme baturini TaxID=241478 RepID=A0A183J9Q9_9BILA|nr:unnamed protein product [Soboliphyme baturini]